MTKTRQILKRLIEVMGIVEKENKELDMRDYYRQSNLKGTDVHTCNTPACVMGYAALDLKCRELAGRWDPIRPDTLECRFSFIVSTEYGAAYRDMFNSLVLANTLFRNHAYRLMFPNEKQDFAHLNSEDPEPKDVIVFIKHLDGLLDKVEQKNKRLKG